MTSGHIDARRSIPTSFPRKRESIVVPAKPTWIPACAGMTSRKMTGIGMLHCSGYTRTMSLLFRDAAGPSLAPGGSIVCVGAFDGVHLGHRALLERVSARARSERLVSCAVTFEPIPREFFARSAPVPRLGSAREKLERLFDAGIERVLMLRFDSQLAAMTAEDFVERVLRARCGLCEIWVGTDFRFGHARRGDVDLLCKRASSD